jgi:hypothetical protein
MTEFDRDRILAVIGRLSFRAARARDRFGRPQVAHEYTMRERADDEADYIALHNAINAGGVIEVWRGTVRAKGKSRRYLYPGDGWRYWHMAKTLGGPPGPDNRIINRNRVEDAVRMREAGLIS